MDYGGAEFVCNFETQTYTLLEWHGDPYNQFCIIGYGVELDLVEIGDPA